MALLGGAVNGGRPWAAWRLDPDAGFLIVELLVSLMILGLGGTLAIGVLSSATRRVEQAELDLRAAIYLSELSSSEAAGWVAPDSTRPAGPGRLTVGAAAVGIAVWYEPPASGAPRERLPNRETIGFRAPQSWRLSDGS